ncbi:aspartic peptidase domain-containing protein [Gloeopeniophorella convolvens]|nr:aspartic peptidase domain-containing protein [Gloeopeniophorella convolvens]
MFSRRSLLIYVLVESLSATPLDDAVSRHAVHNGRFSLPIHRRRPLLPQPPVDGPDSVGMFDPSFAERESRAIMLKYADADSFLSGIGLTPDDAIDLAARYSPAVNASAPALPAFAAGTESFLANSSDPDTNANASALDAAGAPHLPLRDFVSGGLDVLFYGPIGIGTPSQALTVDVDTGSADLWVPTGCRTCHGRQFTPAQSSTYHVTSQDFSVTYGTGRVAGRLATDTVELAGLRVPAQAFGAVSAQTDDFAHQPNDGLIGMAFGTIAQTRRPPFFENLIRARALAAPIFSVHLARHEETGSAVCIGCVDYSKTTGPVTWLPVVSKTYWTVRMDGLFANGVKAPTQITAAIDTGTSLIYVPQTVATAFYALIPGSERAPQYGSGFWTVPCAPAPRVELSFGGHRFALAPADFYLGRAGAGSKDCVAGVLAVGAGLPPDLAIVGDEFLKSWYSTYDYGSGARVGFWPDVNNA